MDHVDLRRRREDRDRARRKPEASRRSVARDSLFLLIGGFASGALASFFLSAFLTGSLGYLSPAPFLFLAVISLLVLLCYAGWRLSGRGAETVTPKPGSEKQLLMAIQGAGGGITPVEAALETSLTVDEAEEILTRFADRGHLVVQSRDGALLYTLPGRRSTPGPSTV
ncbi:hypothetical protein BH24ACT18_BH24ACT18_14850 [soil metagenome]|nr:hypothetical protein [Rubrobacter sp.]MDQ3360134.1 hypothetical protein [Actinomycetota bacterium]